MRKVILSAPLLLEEGTFEVRKLSLVQAQKWVKENDPKNFCSHPTVKVLGIEPAITRATCLGYDEALCLKPRKRLDFSKEYTAEEILRIGIIPLLITKKEG